MAIVLQVNSKWKRTEVYEAITKCQINIQYDEEMTLLDFEANNSGYCYIQKTDGRDFKLRISEYRKLLVKIHNKYSNLKICAFVDYTDRLLFNAIQIFATIELKIQVIPVESPTELAQFLEIQMLTENKENPLVIDSKQLKPIDSLVNCISRIPKVGEKNSKTLSTVFQNLKNCSNATAGEIRDIVGANCSKNIIDFFQSI